MKQKVEQLLLAVETMKEFINWEYWKNLTHFIVIVGK